MSEMIEFNKKIRCQCTPDIVEVGGGFAVVSAACSAPVFQKSNDMTILGWYVYV